MQRMHSETQERMQECADIIAVLFDDLRELKGLNSHLDRCILRNLNELTALRNILYRQIVTTPEEKITYETAFDY